MPLSFSSRFDCARRVRERESGDKSPHSKSATLQSGLQQIHLWIAAGRAGADGAQAEGFEAVAGQAEAALAGDFFQEPADLVVVELDQPPAVVSDQGDVLPDALVVLE
jgi:hypothetical protein